MYTLVYPPVDGEKAKAHKHLLGNRNVSKHI